MALHVWAKFNSAIVPALAGRLAVTDPSAPVTGCSVTVPLVALPKATEPAVPEAPSDKAPALNVAFASVAGAAPAPPPSMIALADSSALDVKTVVLEK